jgi:hypothetical protein
MLFKRIKREHARPKGQFSGPTMSDHMDRSQVCTVPQNLRYLQWGRHVIRQQDLFDIWSKPRQQ